MLYRLSGIVASSDQPLRDIPVFNGSNVDIWIRCLPKPQFSLPMTQWFMHWYLPGGELWLSFAKMDGGYLLRFNKLANFFVNGDGKNIVYVPEIEIPSNTIRHLLLDQVIPLVINLRGGEALHASAVLTQEGAIAFAGATGMGKSTLAGSFLSARHPLLSDDCLAIMEKNQDIYAVPAYPGLRLWEDASAWLFGKGKMHNNVAHYTDKYQIDIEIQKETYYTEPQQLKRVYIIVAPPESKEKTDIVIEPLSHRDSFMALVQYAFRLDITDQNMLKRQFHFLERVASCVSVRRLIFPKDFNLLPAVREAILDDLKNTDN
jgi:hypothetical protein